MLQETCLTANDLLAVIEEERIRQGLKKSELMRRSGVYYYHFNHYQKRGPNISDALLLLNALGLKISIERK